MMRPLDATRLLRSLAALTLLAPLPAPAQDRADPDPELVEIEFIPAEPVDWGIRNVGALITAPVLWSYWYAPGSVSIETVPAHARLELFYIRANFQKLFRRVNAPVRLALPSRIMTTGRDALTVRVAAEGYKTHEYTYDVTSVPNKLVLELEPLQNALTFLALTDLANRTTLTFRTDEEPEFRITKGHEQRGFTLSLRETANALEGHEPLSGGRVKLLEVTPVGEDLLIRIETDGEDSEARSKLSYDPIREEHVFSLEILDPGARMPSPASVRRELEAVSRAPDDPSPDDPCLEALARALREGLEEGVIGRAHRSSGGIADLYRRQAMLRLGRADRGRVWTGSGETLRTGSPLELELALQGAADGRGYLGLLGALARRQSDPETALRSLIAPELRPSQFAPVYARAERARLACTSGSGD